MRMCTLRYREFLGSLRQVFPLDIFRGNLVFRQPDKPKLFSRLARGRLTQAPHGMLWAPCRVLASQPRDPGTTLAPRHPNMHCGRAGGAGAGGCLPRCGRCWRCERHRCSTTHATTGTTSLSAILSLPQAPKFASCEPPCRCFAPYPGKVVVY